MYIDGPILFNKCLKFLYDILQNILNFCEELIYEY